MTPEAQQRAIAIACGWTMQPYQSRHGAQKSMWHHPNGTPMGFTPDYLHDLDAMHKAVMALPSNTRDLVNHKLCEITAGNFDYSETHDMDAALNATADERAEAFLRAIGQWVEETESQPA